MAPERPQRGGAALPIRFVVRGPPLPVVGRETAAGASDSSSCTAAITVHRAGEGGTAPVCRYFQVIRSSSDGNVLLQAGAKKSRQGRRVECGGWRVRFPAERTASGGGNAVRKPSAGPRDRRVRANSGGLSCPIPTRLHPAGGSRTSKTATEKETPPGSAAVTDSSEPSAGSHKLRQTGSLGGRARAARIRRPMSGAWAKQAVLWRGEGSVPTPGREVIKVGVFPLLSDGDGAIAGGPFASGEPFRAVRSTKGPKESPPGVRTGEERLRRREWERGDLEGASPRGKGGGKRGAQAVRTRVSFGLGSAPSQFDPSGQFGQ